MYIEESNRSRKFYATGNVPRTYSLKRTLKRRKLFAMYLQKLLKVKGKCIQIEDINDQFQRIQNKLVSR